jgi:hypothetical protein
MKSLLEILAKAAATLPNKELSRKIKKLMTPIPLRNRKGCKGLVKALFVVARNQQGSVIPVAAHKKPGVGSKSVGQGSVSKKRRSKP